MAIVIVQQNIEAPGVGDLRDERSQRASVQAGSEGNLLVLGDATDELLSLSAIYAGRVRLALIDPPYNTSAVFHHYRDSAPREEWLDQRRAHVSDIRTMLTEDGSVWMHLDDSEVHHARVMLDQVFGESNFIATVVWQKTLSRENRTAISEGHEYLVAYARDRRAWASNRNLLPPSNEQLKRYRNPDDDPRGPWTSGDMTAKAGPGRRASQFYEIISPSGRAHRPAPGMAWRYTRDRYEELLADDRVTFGPRGDNMPRLKRFFSETLGGLVPTSWWPGEEVGTTDSAKKQIRRLFPDKIPFETPKPEELASRVIHIASDPGDLVLDCYAGTGTTPAVAHKMGRRWIAIERAERTYREFLLPRMEAVVAGEAGGVSQEFGWTGGGSFQEAIAG